MFPLPSLPPMVAAHAAAALTCSTEQPRVLLVADMSEDSREPRLVVFDLRDPHHPTVVMRTLVAHGKGSSDPHQPTRAMRFGDVNGSMMTSLGLYRISTPYTGKSGPSYRLEGLSATNAHAFERDIDLHPSSAFAASGGLGHSEGCPMVAPSALASMTQHFGTLMGGLLWIDGPGVQAPTCAALRWPPAWTMPEGSVWAQVTSSQACSISV